MKLKKILIVTIGFVAAFLLFRLATAPKGSLNQDPIPANAGPVQEQVDSDHQEPISKEVSGYNWIITPKAEFRIAARVLSTERYRWEWQSTLSPIDLALGWGELSSSNADRWIDWSQSGRWYFYEWEKDSPYQGNFIQEHSSNVHIIPATQNVESAVLRLHADDMVLLEGLLVNVDGNRGSNSYWWHTSLSRTDSGDGSCELLYLTRLVSDGKEYR